MTRRRACELEAEPRARGGAQSRRAPSPEPERGACRPRSDELAALGRASTRRASSRVPDGYGVLEGEPTGERRAVGDRRQPLQRRAHDAAARVGARRARARPGVAREAITVDARAGRVRAAARGDGARQDAPLRLHRRARLRHPRRDAALRLRRERGGERAPARRDSRPASRSRSACSRSRRPSRPRPGSTRAPRPSARRSRWPTSSRSCARSAGAAAGNGAARRYTPPADVQGLRSLREEAGFGHNRSHSMVATKRRFNPNLQRVRVLLDGKADARVRLHALPQGRQGPEGRLAATAPGRAAASNRAVDERGLTIPSDLGRITVSPEAIAQIVGRAAAECYGVVGMSLRGAARARCAVARRAPGARHRGRPRRDGAARDRPPRRRRVRAQPRRGRGDGALAASPTRSSG